MEQRLSSIKAELCQIRQDRTRYVKADEVLKLYLQFQDALVGISPSDRKDNDKLISDIMLLLSLSFITVGFTRHITSQYARALTLRMLFMFLIADPAFTFKELQVLKSSLDRLKDASQGDDGTEAPVITLMKERYMALVSEIEEWYDKVSTVISQLPETVWPIHNQVIHLRRDILAEVINPEFSKSRLEQYGNKLRKIQFHMAQSEEEPSPIVEYQIKKAFTLVEYFSNGISKADIETEDPQLYPIFTTLRETLSEIDVFVLTRRWTMRCSDLFERMESLLNMESLLLVNTKCPSKLNQPTGPIRIDPSRKYWYLCTYVARRTWALIFRLLDTTEPVSEALSSIYNQLSTLRRCLVEVQDAGVSNHRELYPYQMKLDSLERLRVDGKFVVNGEIPPGQGLINGLLAQCYDMILELEVEIDEKQGDESENENDYSDGYTDSDAASKITYSADSLRSSYYDRDNDPEHEHTDDDHLADVPDANE